MGRGKKQKTLRRRKKDFLFPAQQGKKKHFRGGGGDNFHRESPCSRGRNATKGKELSKSKQCPQNPLEGPLRNESSTGEKVFGGKKVNHDTRQSTRSSLFTREQQPTG